MQLQHILFAALTGSASAHIHMISPAPITAQENPNSGGSTDFDINAPLADMSQFPCKGVLSHLGTPVGAAVDTWAPGSQQSITIGTGASHNGGSCQISLSYDQGATFKVIKDIIGNCPTQGGQYSITIPSDAPESNDVVLSWSWINHTGNREFYQNCAVVNIGSGGAKKREAIEAPVKRQTSFDSLPDIFVANINSCSVAEGVDVVFPNPAPDVQNDSTSPGEATGDCGSTGGSGGSGGAGGAGGSGGASAQPSSPAASAVPTTAASIPGGAFVTQTPDAPAATAAPTTLSTAVSAPGAATSAAPPAQTGGSGEGLSGPCPTEGDWNCIGTTSYQRCASGVWSPVMPLSSGTACESGNGPTLKLTRRRDSSLLRRRGLVAREW